LERTSFTILTDKFTYMYAWLKQEMVREAKPL
jgi:hypothetical protein